MIISHTILLLSRYSVGIEVVMSVWCLSIGVGSVYTRLVFMHLVEVTTKQKITYTVDVQIEK